MKTKTFRLVASQIVAILIIFALMVGMLASAINTVALAEGEFGDDYVGCENCKAAECAECVKDGTCCVNCLFFPGCDSRCCMDCDANCEGHCCLDCGWYSGCGCCVDCYKDCRGKCCDTGTCVQNKGCGCCTSCGYWCTSDCCDDCVKDSIGVYPPCGTVSNDTLLWIGLLALSMTMIFIALPQRKREGN